MMMKMDVKYDDGVPGWLSGVGLARFWNKIDNGGWLLAAGGFAAAAAADGATWQFSPEAMGGSEHSSTRENITNYDI